MAIFLILIDLVLAVFCNSFDDVRQRGYYREFAATVKHVVLVECFATLYPVSYTHLDVYKRQMLRYTFGLGEEADAIEAAVKKVRAYGYRTPDIAKDVEKAIGTVEAGDLIAAAI